MKHFLENELLTSLARAFSASAKVFVVVGMLSICIIGQHAYAATAEQLAEIRNHINRGNMLLGRRLFQDAIGEYENALRIDPANQIAKDNIALTHNNWGIHFFSVRKYNEAKEQWEHALKLNPSDGHARRNLKILEQRMRLQPPVANQDGQPEEGDDGPEKQKPKPKPNPDVNANATATDNYNAAPPAVATQGQQEAKLDSTSVIQNPESGAVLIINSSTNYNQPQSEPVTPVSQPAENTTIRIIGGSSATASIVGSGSSLSGNPPPAPVTTPAPTFNIVAPNTGTGSSTYPASTPGSVNTNGSTTTNDNAEANAPIKAAPSDSYTTGAPTVVDHRPPGQSVPLSWPVALDNSPTAQPLAKANSTPDTPSSFTRNRPAIINETSDRGQLEQLQQQEKDADVWANPSATFENKVSQIETTVYGKSTKNVPLLRRIEKLEIDTFGKKKTGAIADRIKDLKESYGI